VVKRLKALEKLEIDLANLWLEGASGKPHEGAKE